jgi:hypothetical protein
MSSRRRLNMPFVSGDDEQPILEAALAPAAR